MRKEQFYDIIYNKEPLQNLEEKNFDEIINEFPYFQTAYILKAQLLSETGSFKYDNFIKIASLYSVDRSLLHDYLKITTKEVCEIQEETQESIIEKQETEIEETIKTTNKISVKTSFTDNEKLTIAKITNKPENNSKEKGQPIIENRKKRTDKTEHCTKKEEKILEIEDKEKLTKNSKEKETPSDKINEVAKQVQKEKNIENNDTSKIKQLKVPEIKELKPEHKEEIIETKGEETIADKIIKSLKDFPKPDRKESIADIILKKAAEIKKIKNAQKVESTSATEKYKANEEIKVEKKLFKTVKLETKSIIKKEEKHAETKKDILSEINKLTNEPIKELYNIENKIPVKKEEKEEMTFTDWLNKIEFPEKSIKKDTKQTNLIDKFISKQKEIRIKTDNSPTTITKEIEDNKGTEKDSFITETLANIYIKQKLYDKAIIAFTKLSLKYPEKNSYFANRIKKLKMLSLENKE